MEMKVNVNTPSNNIIYLDNAATTPCDPRVVEEMSPYWFMNFANPSSPHILGQQAHQVIESCRMRIREALHGSGSVIFTSGSTESNNMAILSILRYSLECLNRRKVLCLSTEHKSVINSVTYFCALLEIKVEWIPVTEIGLIDMNWFNAALDESVGAVIVQLANSETGVIQDVRRISEACHSVGSLCFSDITQAIGRIEVDLDKLGVDYASFTAHKFYGPKGIGALYVAPSKKLVPLTFGGGQEKGIRPGTENVPGIIGLTYALKLCVDELDQNSLHLSRLRDRLWDNLKEVGEVRWNAQNAELLPSHLNVTIRSVKAQELMLRARDIALSAGSACNTATNLPSHVLMSMGLTRDEAEETIRLSVGRFTTTNDIDIASSKLIKAILEIRSRG